MTTDSTVISYQTTDGDGKFYLNVKKEGEYLVGVRKMDYSSNFAGPFNFDKQDTLKLEMRVLSAPQTMDAIVVEGKKIFKKLEIEGFYSRQNSRPANFLTREDIYRDGSILPSTLLNSIPTINVYDNGIFSNRSIKYGCQMAIYVDGMEISGFSGVKVDQVVPRSDDIIGIEVYHSLNTPVRFRSTSDGCGVVVIWTNQNIVASN